MAFPGVEPHPGCTFVGGFAGEPGKDGPQDGPTGYIAPVRSEILDSNIQYAGNYVLIAGITVFGQADYPDARQRNNTWQLGALDWWLVRKKATYQGRVRGTNTTVASQPRCLCHVGL